MSVGWIDEIYNNSTTDWGIQSIDDTHNGSAVETGGTNYPPAPIPVMFPWMVPRFDMDDKQSHNIFQNSRWHMEWCGIPWYYSSKHYKVLRSPTGKATRLFQSQADGINWIWFQDSNTGRVVARKQVPKVDYHCHLRLEEDGAYFDVVNDDGSTMDTLTQINDQAQKWVPIAVSVLAAIFKK